ncbi:NUDIX domain-containing protein [Acutalibacter muris]|uniref:NUDIX domain-containing protein n=1 Tax=Acutalibacter muris TaxID=1796620 RepID=UPI001C3EC20C|nr:NUDIX domain-containing protein [Acutalibacter muris]
MTTQAELTNMCMICDGSKVLVQDRIAPKWSGITFPGGHIEPGESFADAVIREVWEETLRVFLDDNISELSYSPKYTANMGSDWRYEDWTYSLN